MRPIVVGSRGSKLALLQTQSVVDKLKEMHPGIKVKVKRIRTQGDRLKEVPLDRLPGTGAFVKQLEAVLLAGDIDMAVHSLKDMPSDIPQGLMLAAVVARLDPRDVLVSRIGRLSDLPPGSRIGTGSPRRAAQLMHLRPDLKVEALRGNVDTRLSRVSSGRLEGAIVAAAAVLRLGLEERITEYLSLDDFLPSAGQGALGIEIRSGDWQTLEMVAKLNHGPTWSSVTAERAFLRALGGGCRAPIAVMGRVSGDWLKLEGMVAGDWGHVLLRASEEGNAGQPEQLGIRLARKMWRMGASGLITEARLR